MEEKDEEECLRLYEEVTALMTEHVGKQDRRTLTVKMSLAYMVGDVFEQLDRAKLLKQEVVDGYEAVLGWNHPETLTARNNLAATIEKLGEDHQLARQMFEAVYETQRVQLGAMHSETLQTKYNIANIR